LHLKARAVLESLREHWHGCTVFVEYPEIPMDNNESERRLRGPVCGRKNYYGCGSEWSAELTAMLYSIFDTMKKNQIHPGKWLGAYLGSCAEAGGRAPEEGKLESFLPWNLTEEKRTEWKLSDKPP
jgi:transposase